MPFYVARDKSGELFLFGDRPQRSRDCWWAEVGVDGTYVRLVNSMFPDVTWESEPLPVSINPVD
jgi:hypothetical protein